MKNKKVHELIGVIILFVAIILALVGALHSMIDWSDGFFLFTIVTCTVSVVIVLIVAFIVEGKKN